MLCPLLQRALQTRARQPAGTPSARLGQPMVLMSARAAHERALDAPLVALWGTGCGRPAQSAAEARAHRFPATQGGGAQAAQTSGRQRRRGERPSSSAQVHRPALPAPRPPLTGSGRRRRHAARPTRASARATARPRRPPRRRRGAAGAVPSCAARSPCTVWCGTRRSCTARAASVSQAVEDVT